MRHVVVTARATASSACCASTPGCGTASESAQTGITLGDVARRNFTIVRENDIVFDVIRPHVARKRRHGGRGQGRPACRGPTTWSA